MVDEVIDSVKAIQVSIDTTLSSWYQDILQLPEKI